MVLTKSELIALFQHETRVLLHLASKIDRSQLDYRPTPKQRSTLELLQYLSTMGPGLIGYAINGGFDQDAYKAAAAAAAARDFDQTLAVIATHPDTYAKLLDVSDDVFRGEIDGFDGQKRSRGSFIVSVVLGGCAAYRTQLFLYLKACGREELTTANLWMGTDPPPSS